MIEALWTVHQLQADIAVAALQEPGGWMGTPRALMPRLTPMKVSCRMQHPVSSPRVICRPRVTPLTSCHPAAEERSPTAGT